jgi:hypothetical protein
MTAFVLRAVSGRVHYPLARPWKKWRRETIVQHAAPRTTKKSNLADQV